MTQKPSAAFAELDARAAKEAGLADRISLRDYVLDVEIGAFQAERGVSQRVQFNVVVEVRAMDGAQTDDVDRILSYDTLVDAITHELAAERINLLETLAERIAARILLHPQAAKAYIRLEKLDRGPFALGVEIVRAAAAQESEPEMSQSAPHVICLGQGAVQSPDLIGFLDAYEQRGIPIILCVAPLDLPQPQATAKPAQRRIDLLALEQAAWVLAARDPRCVVVESRTELDYAISQKQIVLWAPSKLVLDATTPPSNDKIETLAQWLALEFGAAHLLYVGGTPPEIPCDIPTTVTSSLQVGNIPPEL